MVQSILHRHHRLVGISIVALLLAITIPVFAQEEVPPARHRRQVDPEKVKQLLEKVHDVKHQKLREILNLDDETAKKFFALYDPAEQDLISLVKQRQEQEIKLLELTRGEYKDADVDPTMQSIKTLNQQILERYDALDNSLKPVISPRQRAHLLLFEKEFNRKVREKIRQKREQWKDNHPGRPFRPKGDGKPPVRPGIK